MSFQNAAAGVPRQTENAQSKSLRDVEGLVFQMANGVAQLKRLVAGLGTPRDTVDLRHQITDKNDRIQGLAKDIKQRVTAFNEDKSPAAQALLPKSKKLLQDFATILQDYKATQKLAAEKEASSLPRTPAAPLVSSGQQAGREEEIERQALLQQHAMEEARALETALVYNEALIEERDHSIMEIQRQIGEVNEMFQDLAVLINDQGTQLQTIDTQITTTAERTLEAKRELVVAERSQRASRNKCLLLALVAALIVSILLILIFVT